MTALSRPTNSSQSTSSCKPRYTLSHLWIKPLIILVLSSWPFTNHTALADSEFELPKLGQTGNHLMSRNQEKALGQAWLRSFRGRVPLQEDPLLFEYIENLLMTLASHSALEDRSLDLVVIENKTINAFAVPGGVVGVHTGLLLNSKTEGQLASVLTHELAHLSQHHFARGVEAAQNANLVSVAGMLAGLVLAATAGGDAATAAIATTQAAAIDNQLRYSRAYEREADRLGMKTLHESGYRASEAAGMFRQMQEASRLYGSGVPEFLRTHPVTKSRIADAENRSRQLGESGASDTLDFQLMKARTYVLSQTDTSAAIKHYEKLFNQLTAVEKADSPGAAVIRYGLTLAYNKAGKWKKARKTLDPLLVNMQGKIPYLLLDIEIDIIEAGNLEFASRRLRDLYALTPANYPIGMLLAKTAVKQERYATAEKVLQQLAEKRPKQTDIWFLLAEVHGLAGNIAQLHLARAEFFILRGNFRQARHHLSYALKVTGNNFNNAAKIKQRLRDVVALEKQRKALG